MEVEKSENTQKCHTLLVTIIKIFVLEVEKNDFLPNSNENFKCGK
jgi:hypothetical protein